MKQIKTVGFSLLTASLLGVPLSMVPSNAWAETSIVQQAGVLKGVVKSTDGEPLMGAVVFVVGGKSTTTTDENGAFTLKGVNAGATVRVSLIGYKRQDLKWTGGTMTFALEEEGNVLNEAVVTAMGIVRKEKSLTYATQQIKADELMKVQ
ncbi:MAG: carboxypeptidase-like regulatory domain-containing protein, partial [Bacteroidaceae bacterium]|nr:carboxypeptidase-like regulatory domain-containing protein [Bacteroidaceae bacterium]